MQVYSVGYLCLGIFVSGVGTALLSISLLAAVKRKKFKTYEDRKSIYSSLYFMLWGANWTSRAFDPPYQSSQRTDIIGFVLLPYIFVMLIVLFLEKRRLPKGPTA